MIRGNVLRACDKDGPEGGSLEMNGTRRAPPEERKRPPINAKGESTTMTQDEQETAIVGMFESLISAEEAIVALHREGLDMKRLSIDGNVAHAEQHILDSVKDGAFLVLVHGTTDMIVHARAILGTTDPSQFETLGAVYSSRIAAEIAPD